MARAVVKVGGSLFDLPDLGTRLRHFLAVHENQHTLLVPGGGTAADVIRAYDRVHALGEEAAHWLALRMLQVNAHFLAKALGLPIVDGFAEESPLAVLDAFAFARADEGEHERLPHLWTAGSDCVAARVATVGRAGELVLLKSVAWSGSDWNAAAAQGIVDGHFPDALRATRGMQVRIVNLRQESPNGVS